MRKLATLFSMSFVLIALPAQAQSVDDPAEPFNRAMYSFNDGLDRFALKPLAQAYDFVTPLPLRVGFTNFINNFRDIPNAINNLLQGKVVAAVSDVGRIAVNSSFGILGVIDVATEFGLERHNEDFGQTLGYWGMPSGPYVVLPFYGPSTVRDTFALPVDYAFAGRHLVIERVAIRNTLTGFELINDRAALLGAEKALDEAALDKYAFIRNFYLQRRQSLVYDGNPPRPKDEDDVWDESTDAAPEAAEKGTQ
jgi:phospholipid-binding lipoprotein MlaA